VCDVETWESEIGISVCRLYKALFSFALLGLVATLLALGLDVRVQRSATKRGRFQQLQMLDGEGKRDVDGRGLGVEEGNHNTAAARRYRGEQGRGGDGYALPEEQFGYEDTAYQGAAGQMGR
jgi:hypothetical protein